MHTPTRWFPLCSALFLGAWGSATNASPLKTGMEIPLWDHTAPGAEQVQLEEKLIDRTTKPDVHDRAWLHVLHPSLTAYVPAKPNGCSVIVAAGGGYERIVIDKEGTDLAPILNAEGITLFILKYRLPGDGFANRQLVPLQDAQRAIRVVRANAQNWHLSADQVGIVGFSAGGQLAASLATRFTVAAYPAGDAIDQQSARPDFVGLLYPVISMDPVIGHSSTRKQLLGANPTAQEIADNSLEQQVTAATPPAFIALADDDKSVNPLNSIHFYEQLHQAGVPAEMHIFQKSGHGFGIRNAKGNAKLWPRMFLHWLKANHMLTPATNR